MKKESNISCITCHWFESDRETYDDKSKPKTIGKCLNVKSPYFYSLEVGKNKKCALFKHTLKKGKKQYGKKRN